MSAPENKLTLCAIDILPDELILNIFKLLPLESVLECEKVCNRWKKLARDKGLWRSIVFVYSGKPGQSEFSKKSQAILETHNDCVRCLKVQYVYGYLTVKSIIQQCNYLISLELVMCRINKELEDDILKYPNLKKINLKNSVMLVSNTDLFIEYDKFKNLNYLVLSDFGLPEPTRDSLLRCKYLCHISIEKIKNLDVKFVKDLIRTKMDILKVFHIYGGDACSDECLLLLSQCKLLQDLSVVRCENLTDAGLIHLTKLENIEHLQIWNNNIFSEANLHRVLKSPSLTPLRSLSLSRVGNISPRIVDVISEDYKKLKFLALYQCPKIINTDYEKQLKSKFRNIDVVLY